MNREEIIKILKEHNEWRRGNDDYEMTEPKDLGIAIDEAIKLLKQSLFRRWLEKLIFTIISAKNLLMIASTHLMITSFVTSDQWIQLAQIFIGANVVQKGVQIGFGKMGGRNE